MDSNSEVSYFLSLLTILLILSIPQNTEAQDNSFRLSSPDKNIEVRVQLGAEIQYSIRHSDKQILELSPLSLEIEDEKRLGDDPDLIRSNRNSVDEVIHPVVHQKSSEIINRYNELILDFAGNYRVIFRAYNDGIAYRFETDFDRDRVIVNSEQIVFNFAEDYDIYFPEEESFMTHQERTYSHVKLSDISSEQFSSIPALVDISDGPKLLITESDLQDYPGYYLQGTNSASLTGILPEVAVEETLRSDRDYYVTERADYLAETSGSRTYPWRMIGIAETDGELITNQMVFKLAEPSKIADPSWIKPGKVSWDWWNANNIYDVDFRAGINTETYKYYIDFASQLGLDYIILDEGWYELRDLLSVSPDIDIPEIVEYGKKKDVDIILWVVWKTLEDQWEAAFQQFSQWDIKGLKIDFMQRDDQWMINWYWKAAEEAAKHELLVNFHGAYKPSGLRRTYPNVMTREGLKGLEHNKWSEDITPQHNVTIPFIRMAAGPMDYTPGAMINAQPVNFQPIYNRPMSQGTRAHQLAMYVIYESPQQMLADSPTHYLEQKQNIRDFLSDVPVTWEETRVLDASIGDYIVVARKKGDRWYIGAMTDENPREFSLDLSFIEGSDHEIKFYRDGINADRYGSDYEFRSKEINTSRNLDIKLAEGGGWVGIIEKSD
jgi:alpha-glucosidase